MHELVVKRLRQKGLTVAFAESCTGGLVSAALTSVPGSSDCFGYGVVTYSNQAKQKLLGVPQEILERFGAVSCQTAKLMASGVRKLAHADMGVSVTGIAGPTGGSAAKPVGLVYIALAKEDLCVCNKFQFQGSREDIRRSTVDEALKMLLNMGLEYNAGFYCNQLK